MPGNGVDEENSTVLILYDVVGESGRKTQTHNYKTLWMCSGRAVGTPRRATERAGRRGPV